MTEPLIAAHSLPYLQEMQTLAEPVMASLSQALVPLPLLNFCSGSLSGIMSTLTIKTLR